MDCEKFETSLLAELYDELDEVTSAAAKRHVAGCSRCASLLSGLRATRRLATLGVGRIFGGGECTFAAADRYFSHRRDGVTGRQATLIWLEPA